MKLPVFAVEQWMTDHEKEAVYNLTDTCVRPLTLQELLAYEPDFTPDFKLDYGEITGDEALKKEILKLYESGNPDQLTFAHGCNQANELVMETLLEPGDRVVTFTPAYQAFTDYPRSLGCEVVEIPLLEDHGWQPDLNQVHEVLSEKTKMIILNMPNNPTGSVLQEEIMQDIMALAKRHRAYILCDEVYRSPDLPSLSDRYPLAICTSSLSKLYSLAGLRFGWIKAAEEIIDLINYRKDYSIISSGPLLDRMALIAFTHQEEILGRSYSVVADARRVVKKWLEEEKRCSLVMPEFGTVSFLQYNCDMESSELCTNLQEKYGVFFVPSSCFGMENHLRLTFTQSPEVMEKGLKLFSQYMDEIEAG